jgi:hypothetical protein
VVQLFQFNHDHRTFSKLSRAGSGPLPGPVAAIDPDTTPPIAAIKKPTPDSHTGRRVSLRL